MLNNLQITPTVSISGPEREKLESKMRLVFEDQLNRLSEDLQSALTDDIVTAFLARIGLFIEIEAEKKRYTRTKRSLNP